MQSEHLLPPTDASNNNTISVISAVINDNTLNSNNNDNHINICQHDKYPSQSSLSMTNDSLYIKEHQLVNPTIKSRSDSEDIILENKKVIKRELRRKKKRETTRVWKEKQDIIRQDLEKQVQELEFKQNNLLSQVENLQLYKEQLEIKCKQLYSDYKLFGRLM
ncbi:unnamed protein product [Rotaria sp. Silwood2]|nr:unnamed protein product [Rotaria sp. Silwood2]CAF4217708.1 unnamed protein product [Rotaria sp. Silwood2]